MYRLALGKRIECQLNKGSEEESFEIFLHDTKGPREVGSKQNRAEQKRRQNVIENPLRRPGEKSRAKQGSTRGGSGQREQRMVVGFSLHSAGPPRKTSGYILRAHGRANTFDR